MSMGHAFVKLTIDTSNFLAALSRVEAATRKAFWSFRRTHLVTPGDRHIDRIVRDCLDRRLPAEQTAIRLIAASDLAAVLDGEAGA